MPLYHVWFATKNRKWLLQGDVLEAARELLRQIADEKRISLLECEAVVDHARMLLEVADKSALSKSIGLLKGASAYQIFLRFPELKLDAGINNFWQAGYGSKIVPPSAQSRVRQYIRTQWDRLEDYER